MSVGPLNRLTGTVGLVALAPTALLSATGSLTAGDTAERAAVTFVAVIVVRRVARWYLSAAVVGLERRVTPVATPPAAPPGERRTPRQGAVPAPPEPQEAPRRRQSDA